MDYEREADSAPGEMPSESQSPETAGEAYEMAASEPATDAINAAQDAETQPQAYAGAGADEAAAGSEQAATDADATPAAHAGQDAADSAAPADSTSDLGSDADVMDDSFTSSLRPPEWPAADFAAPASPDEVDEAHAAAASNAAVDIGDDSDAPVLDDAAAAAAGAAAAEHVNLNQGGVSSINASKVTFSQGGAGQVYADEMHVSQSGVGLARVNNLTLGEGASAFAVLADQATVEEGSNTFLVVSRSVNGQVRSTIDWRAAMAFGAGLGLILSIFRRLR